MRISHTSSDGTERAGTEIHLSDDEILRYSRHLLIPEIGVRGQEALKSSSVLVVGAGGLGSPASMYLAAAGIGTIGLVDYDSVDLSNLQRQILHSTADVGRSKLQSARETIEGINPNVNVQTIEAKLSSENALDVLSRYDIIVDGTDNFPTRYLINDACVLLGKPNVYGSIFRFEGQVSVFDAKRGPCYRCLFASPPPPGMVPSCAEGGVLGVLPGIVGSIQALEAIKYLTGAGENLIGRLVLFDALKVRIHELHLNKNPACIVCGSNPSVKQLIDYEGFCGMRRADQIVDAASEITVRELKDVLDKGDEIFLLDVREPQEYAISNLGGYLIPVNELSHRLGELDQRKKIVVYCRSGVRSARAVEILRGQHFPNVRNLIGGIEAWAREIDPEIRRY